MRIYRLIITRGEPKNGDHFTRAKGEVYWKSKMWIMHYIESQYKVEWHISKILMAPIPVIV